MDGGIGRLLNADRRALAKAIEVLHGLVAGVMADGVLNNEEIRFIDLWLTDNAAVTRLFPGDVLARRVRGVLKDGRIDEIEREQLQQVLSSMLGGTMQETGSASIGATSLPINDDVDVEIDGNFCLTGEFVFGPRPKCIAAIERAGGRMFSGVTKDVDYLVVGAMGSQDWVHSSFGTKIEKAISYRDKGYGVEIISEQRWLAALEE